jgi:hypothetical protein
MLTSLGERLSAVLGSYALWCYVLTTIAAICLGIGASDACQSEGCTQGCKAHNRWCSGTYGFRTVLGGPIARVECVQAPDTGDTPVELDQIEIRVYDECVKDCPSDGWTTGAPHGFAFFHVGFYNTRCTTLPSHLVR